MKVSAIGNGIIFHFMDPVNTKGEFVRQQTSTGILLTSTVDNSAKQPRWVKVLNAGPDCTFVKQGDIVLLPSLRWTSGLKFEGNRIWKTDETEVAALLVNNEVIPAPSYLTFRIIKNEPITHQSGLFVVCTTTDATPSGTVIRIGENVLPELANTTIYYDGTNFNDMIENTDVAFIKEDNVFAYMPN